MINDFPTSPAVDDEYTSPVSGVVYKYDAKGRWIIIATQSDQWINREGDTMTGALTLNADPTLALHAASKQYVDSSVGESSMFFRHTVSQLGYLSWDFEVQDALGNPDPVDPTQPGQVVYINQTDTQLQVKVVLAYSGDLLVSQQIFYTTDGGTTWLAAGNATDPDAKLTLTYSTQVGFESTPVSGAWS